MKITVTASAPKDQALITFAFEGANLPAQAVKEGFKAKPCSVCVVHSDGQAQILVGLGDKKKFKVPEAIETLRRAAAAGARKANALSQKKAAVLLPNALPEPKEEARVIAEGALLSSYKFEKYKSEKAETRVEELTLVAQKGAAEAKKGAEIGEALANATCFVRDMVNEPPSDLTPDAVAEIAEEVAQDGKGAGVTIKVFRKKDIQAMKMGALLGVAKGSAEEPAFIHLHYKPAGAKKSVALVGKGITFDSGGLSLKPAVNMESMKMDMAGAASILGVFRAIPTLKPKVEIHGILAVTENMPGGRACKPGDVSRAMNGKTIEVLNTDAEGRLVLADALSYTVKLNPDKIIDIATLTGACIIALGSLVAGAMGNDGDLYKEIAQAGEESGERFCQFPLVPEYKDSLKSQVADLQNISSVRGEAGSIIGGLFLEEFVDGKDWIHLDIAGPAWAPKDFHYLTPGGTGFPTRTLLHYLLSF